jgi:hypothetical protein
VICVQERTAFKAMLTTKGRRSGTEHSVWLRAVFYEGRIYFSRRNQNADWLKNAISSPTVKVKVGEQYFVGTATLVTDESLARMISELKYPGEDRAQEARIVLQVDLH